RCFRHAAPRLWNGLPAELRSCTSLSAFKRMLKNIYWQHRAKSCNRRFQNFRIIIIIVIIIINVIVYNFKF
ncbi:hypothetical protein HELRODRAFT_67143, partial [Helobdella robusta]|uniref:Ion transport domain-containing protein n=1 Tax=Helobdella robusta TaxID=6412 RepID=T1FYX3_HELRO